MQKSVLRASPHGVDKRKHKLVARGQIQRLHPLEFFCRQPVQPCACLLARRRCAHLHPSAKVRVSTDQRQLLLQTCSFNGTHHGLMQSRYCGKRPRRPRLLRNPRRVLEDAAKRGDKSFPIETVHFGERHRHRYGERVSSTRYTRSPRTPVPTTPSAPPSVKR